MANKTIHADLEYQTEAILGEGPVWDEDRQKYWWVDIISGKLHRYDPAENTDISFDVGEHIGAAALRKEGGMLLALKSGFAFFDDKTGKVTPIADHFRNDSGMRFNDGKCDPAGRFWAGTMAYDVQEGAGKLYCLNSNLEAEIKIENLTIPNGLAWNSQGDSFFFIDTIAGDLYSFNYDIETGEISDKLIVMHIDKKDGYPDGMTIDNENMLWVALYGGGKVIRINPVNGEIVFEVILPVPKPTSCTFGGKNLDQLFITTCREHMNEKEISAAPLSGSLFSVSLPFGGLPADRFAG